MAGVLGIVSSVVGIAGGVNALTGGGLTGGDTSQGQAQQMADPFSSYRSNLGAMYAGALQPGASTDLQSMPGYTQFNTGVMQPALQASQRQAAGTGMLYSGNEQLALQKTGQQGYYGFMTDYLNRLAQGSGAVNNPAQAAGMGLAQGNLNQQGVMQGLGSLQQQFAPGGSANSLFGSAGSTMGNYNPSGDFMGPSAPPVPDIYTGG